MTTRIGYASFACAALILLVGTLPVSAATAARFPLTIGIAGDYRVTVEVLPPESFTGPKARLVRDGGEQPIALGGSQPPNHRLAVIVMDNGRLVEQADVVILYRNTGPRVGPWVRLPVVRTHVAGKGPETTEFGNNVRLGPGLCEVSVSVNGQGAAISRFLLRS